LMKKFLGYNQQTLEFNDEDNTRWLYKWIIRDPENNYVQKISSPKNIRDLNKIIENKDALEKFKDDKTTLEEALAVVLKYSSISWRDEVNQAVESLKKIPTDELESLNEDDRRLLSELKQIIEKRLIQYDKIKGFK